MKPKPKPKNTLFTIIYNIYKASFNSLTAGTSQRQQSLVCPQPQILLKNMQSR